MRRSSSSLSLVLAGLALLTLAGLAFFGQSARALMQTGQTGRAANVTVLQAHLDTSAPQGARAVAVTSLNGQDHTIDMGQLGIRPTDRPLPLPKGSTGPNLLLPNGNAVGLGAFMSVSPDVVSQSTSSAIATLSTDFNPSESVQYYLNGVLAGTFTADASGRVAVSISTGAGQGYITFRAVGVTSGKQAGGAALVLDNAPQVPGLAVGPHAINPTGTSTIYLYGVRYPTTNTVTLARNTTVLGTANTNATGRFLTSITVAAGADASAVYNAYTNTAGSMAGQSIEERADAGPPPIGDQNVSRAFPDRAVLDSATGGTFAIVGEGFQVGETVNVSVCATAALAADANGAVGAFLTGGPGAGVYNCTFTGATSARVARVSVLAAANAVNAPSAINRPATVSGTGTFVFLASKLQPSQAGTVYVDGVAQGVMTTTAAGYGAIAVTKPITGFEHAVTWLGTNGQGVVAPLITLPGGSGTPTATTTATASPTVCAANYTYVTSTNTIISGTVDVGNHCDDCVTTVALPFAYQLYDQTVLTATVGSNGMMSFGTINNTFNPGCLPLATGTYLIAPYSTDQCTGPCFNVTCAGCGIFTSTTGTAPNRIFNIEWRTAYYNSGGNGVPLDYEVRLYEGQTRFDVVYGTVNTFTPPSARSLSVGVQKNNTQYTLVGCDTTGGQNPPVHSGEQITFTLAACGTATTTPTVVGTVSATRTSTASPSVTRTSTAVVTPSVTGTNTTTRTPSTTAVATLTTTGTAQATLTRTSTSVPSVTNTSVPTNTATATCTPINFSDVHPTDYFYNAVQFLACRGAVSGYSDGTFRPYNDTTRGQVSKIIVIAEGFPIDLTGAPHFSDVPSSNPFYAFIETAYNRGIISGYSDGTFRPFNNVTRAQLSKMIVLAEGWPIDTTGGPHFTDVPTTDPFYGYIETAYNHGIIAGYSNGTFRPNNNATRGQISVIIYRALTQP